MAKVTRLPEADTNGGRSGRETSGGGDDPTTTALLEALARSGIPARVRAWINAALWVEDALEALLQ